MPRRCNSRCNSKTVLLRRVLPRKPAFAGGWLTARLTAKQHFWNLRKPQFPAAGFQAGFHGIRHFLDGYRGHGYGQGYSGSMVFWMVNKATVNRGGLTREPPFWAGYQRAGYQGGYHGNQGIPIGTHGPGTQAGTQGKRFSLVHTRVREGCAFYGVQELLRVTCTPKGASSPPI